MEKYQILFNPLSNNGRGAEEAKKLNEILKESQIEYTSVLDISNMEVFLANLDKDDFVLLCGGDGTIQKYLNNAGKELEKHRLFYFACGSGNDFLRDLQEERPASKTDEIKSDSKDANNKNSDGKNVVKKKEPVEITDYVKDLPVVTVQGKQYRFLDNVGFGIDGYCCEEGDRLRACSKEKINYTAIAIKGLLGKFYPANAVITVDGVTREYKKVWLAPTMKGRFYGGGMKITPDQDRMDPQRKVSVAVMFGSGKLKTLMVFPSIFEGKHITHKEMFEVIKGYEIDVTFDRPCAVQIDGETIPNVTNYHVSVPGN
ncbi:MAG: diacylglycerol/lipid kinase family protein [Lachnospiraceae bacterium]